MSECCSSNKSKRGTPNKRACPVDGKLNASVSLVTILHHLRAPWDWVLREQDYYFCSDPDCEVVYFGEDDCIIRKSDLRTPVGIKEDSSSALLCYCFGVTKAEADLNPKVKEFVSVKTKEQVCACEIQNPSGRCCLKDFPR